MGLMYSLTLYLLELSAVNFCEQFGTRSGRTERLMVFLKEFSKELILKKSADNKESFNNYPGGKELNVHVQL